ncbi:G5 domain-containing protein [Herbiconiux sp. CPCC 205716]|uniref:G5 domain-containing protein n=1 Tax=Herbiconiux gentiana TaxID=2970912 RepID=A0ABT2GB92_9MICO|nr:G5 domain-containing protein [Herbiconiux gentiana]MCS5713471.1 G5 domain-containing protein [Herbiconiux gentiana]
MTTTPPGWYTDPSDPTAQRWWDGTRWTEFTSAWSAAPVGPVPPVAPVAPAGPVRSSTARRSWRPTLSTYIVGSLAVLVSIVGAGTNGIGGFLVGLALFGIGAGVYVLVTRRPSFLNVAPTRRAGGAALGISAALLLVGSLMAPHAAPAPDTAEGAAVSLLTSPEPVAPEAATPRPTVTPSPKKTAAPTPTPTPTPVVGTQLVDVSEPIPFASSSYDEPTLELGASVTVTAGVPGTLVKRWQITTTDGVETSRSLVSETVTAAPVDELIAIGSLQPAPPPAPEAAPAPEGGGCDPNYAGGCVPIDSDVDCPGGSGNGPSYAPGPVQVIGSDIYDLDRDGDGWACD